VSEPKPEVPEGTRSPYPTRASSRTISRSLGPILKTGGICSWEQALLRLAVKAGAHQSEFELALDLREPEFF
jgi:hypothetical protein